MTIPNKVYYCPRHNTVKDKPQECPWYRRGSRCLATEFEKCNAVELVTMSKEISAVLVNEIGSLLEKYEDADPPMDRTRFAVEIIEKARGL
jgi:hypothetical protein